MKTLSNEINKEGTTTWGCKEGWLDVEDIKEFIKDLKRVLKEDIFGETKHYIWCKEEIDKLAGDKLI